MMAALGQDCRVAAVSAHADDTRDGSETRQQRDQAHELSLARQTGGRVDLLQLEARRPWRDAKRKSGLACRMARSNERRPARLRSGQPVHAPKLRFDASEIDGAERIVDHDQHSGPGSVNSG